MIDKALLRRLLQTGYAMAEQLKEQGYYGKNSCNVPCEFNNAIKPQKAHTNNRLAGEWEVIAEQLQHNLSD